MSVRLIPGDCLRAMRLMVALGIQVDSIVCDPPYHLTSIVKRFGAENAAPAKAGKTGAYKRASTGFMGKHWDGGDIAFQAETWALAMAVLKPGGHLLAFGGTRGWHRMAVAIEDAGFEIRDTVAFMYGSGFPKAHNLKNKTEIFCDCGGYPIPYDHGKEKSEHDMRSVRDPDVPETVNAGDERGQVLFHGVSEQGSQERGTARAEPETGGTEQPGMEGRALHRTGQGICDDPDAGSSEGAEERLRAGAYSGSGKDAGSLPDRDGGSPPQGLEPGEQRSGESENLCDPSGTLDDGTLRHGGLCPRCGKLTEAFKGFSTALKPAFEPIVLARKPLGEKSVAANVLAHGTGAINVDGCRVGYKDAADQASAIPQGRATAKSGALAGGTQNDNDRAEFQARNDAGRWPANCCHDGSAEVEAAFAAFGENKGQLAAVTGNEPSSPFANVYGDMPDRAGSAIPRDGLGSASRFFYSAKAGPEDRFGSKHPTVKPVALIRWLQRLVTPPGGLTLDPFAGSGTAGVAAIAEGFRAILIEAEPEYQADIRERLAWATGDGRHALAAKARNISPEKTGHIDLPLFASPESAG